MEGSDGASATQVDTLVKRLRLELKQWEQSFAAAHEGRKAGREDIKQHPEIGQRFSDCYLLQSSTDAPKHTSTSSTIGCEDPRNNLALTTRLPQKSTLLRTHTPSSHPALHTNVRSTLIPSTPQRFPPMIHRLLRICLLGPTAHQSGLHLRRMVKFSGSSINCPQPQSRRHLQNEKHYCQ